MLPTTVEVFAPAKINLALHITGQRADGYHLIDSLVAFADCGDRVRLRPGKTLSLAVKGPEADGVPADMQNLALQAAALLDHDAGAELVLEKHLPAASGIGGGSADAAAAVRGMLALQSRTDTVERLLEVGVDALSEHAEALLALGADVPMCLAPRPLRAQGIGERLTPVALPTLAAVLVNPRVPVSTPEVFRALSAKDNSALPDPLPPFPEAGMLIDWLAGQRNDLEAPVRATVPEIDQVLEALRALPECRLARMSGSGATCFGLFDRVSDAASAAQTLQDRQPGWWLAACTLGDQRSLAHPVYQLTRATT